MSESMVERVEPVCIRCDAALENIAVDGRRSFQPIDGLAFVSQGHYGTTFFDPMDGSYIQIAVCDACLRNANEAARIWYSDPRAAIDAALQDKTTEVGR